MKSAIQHKRSICTEDVYPYFFHKDFFNRKVELMKCSNCGHGSYRNIWTQPNFDEIYGDEYAKDYLDVADIHNQRSKQYVLDTSLLKEYCPAT